MLGFGQKQCKYLCYDFQYTVYHFQKVKPHAVIFFISWDYGKKCEEILYHLIVISNCLDMTKGIKTWLNVQIAQPCYSHQSCLSTLFPSEDKEMCREGDVGGFFTFQCLLAVWNESIAVFAVPW